MYYCSNYGPISTTTVAAGGVVGSLGQGTIHYCFNGGSVLSGYTVQKEKTGEYYAGGIVGNATGSNISITDCYNAGMIKAGNKKHTDMAYAAGIAANAPDAAI